MLRAQLARCTVQHLETRSELDGLKSSALDLGLHALAALRHRST